MIIRRRLTRESIRYIINKYSNIHNIINCMSFSI